MSTSIVDAELDYRAFRAPEVPGDLINYVCGHYDFDEFLRSGIEVATLISIASRRYFGKDLTEFERILDFGCGCGRLLRFFRPAWPRLYCCDVGEKVITYSKSSYDCADIYRNDLKPPLKYDSAAFSAIYSFSVFSHLRLDAEEEWLEELQRIAAPGCPMFITVHGDWFIEKVLSDDELGKALREGYFYKKTYEGNWFPEYYQFSCHTSGYIRKNWSRYFDILDVIKGDDAMRYAYDETSRALCHKIRPLGQDMVIARARTVRQVAGLGTSTC